jgi:AAA+ ATPase superfamily predicted ATPase
MFFDRESELELLERHYASGQAEMFVLYGRRRVGKTELLTQFCEAKRHIFFVADLDAEPVLRAGFSSAVNQVLFGSQAAGGVYPDWEQIFLLLAQHARDERLVVVLDEFTYLIAAYPPLASLLQRLWDRTLRHSRIMLVLCGSYVGMMEEAVLGYKAPLYGRRTGQYLLETLGFHEARLFFPGYSAEDQVRSYGVFGGTPGYLQALKHDQPLDRMIQDQVLSRGTFLYDEARFLLQQELRQPQAYFAILEAIASGHTRLNEIKQMTQIEGVSAYLETLQSLRLVERQVPVTETQPHKSRRGLYRIREPFFRFWFRFLHPNRTALERGLSQLIYESRVAPFLDQFSGPVFEDVCGQFLWMQGAKGQLPFNPLKIGGWWRANQEIDRIAVGQDAALVVECKWSSRPVGLDILRDLERKLSLVRAELGERQLWVGLCARSGFTPQVEAEAAKRKEVLLFSLDQIVSV